MSWLITTVVALLCVALSVVLVGLLANACVDWYHISSREGGAGYFVVFLALLGGGLGLIIGIVVSRYSAPSGWGGFARTAGMALGLILLLTGIATALCWSRADIPPRHEGSYLSLEVEFRLPVGTSLESDQPWGLTLGSVESHRQRAARDGEVQRAAARQESGRWVLPGSVFLFTRRGQRVIQLRQGTDYFASFSLPPAGQGGEVSSEWSDWFPRGLPDGQPWPDDKVSYRFRIQPEPQSPPDPSPLEEEAAAFSALAPDAPLLDWLSHLPYEAPPERVQAVMQVVEERQAELAQLIGAETQASREAALDAVPRLSAISAEVAAAVQAEGGAIAAAIEVFNGMSSEVPDFYDVQVALRSRFNHWKLAWWSTFHQLDLDGRPPLQTIHELAQRRAQDTSMDEIVLNARVILDALPASTAPTSGK